MNTRPTWFSVAGVAALVLALVIIWIAPLWMPAGYSPIRHSISESAAQHLRHAWAVRTALIVAAFGAIAVVTGMTHRWTRFEVACGLVFGIAFVFVAIFPHRPWLDGVPISERDDALHSAAANVVGLAIVALLASVVWRRRSRTPWWDGLVLAVVVVVPLVMMMAPDYEGIMQRSMFSLAFVWLIVEWWQQVNQPSG